MHKTTFSFNTTTTDTYCAQDNCQFQHYKNTFTSGSLCPFYRCSLQSPQCSPNASLMTKEYSLIVVYNVIFLSLFWIVVSFFLVVDGISNIQLRNHRSAVFQLLLIYLIHISNIQLTIALVNLFVHISNIRLRNHGSAASQLLLICLFFCSLFFFFCSLIC